VTLLAVFHYIGAFFLITLGLTLVGLGFFGDQAGQVASLVGGVLCGALGAVYGLCASGLWHLKSYGRRIQLVFSWIGLLGFPVGTIISILILVYLYKAGVKVLFSERAPDQYTPEEAAQVADVTRSSMGIAVAVGIIAVVFIMIIGIVAAIAVPGLLRARMSGNEASAIGSLRAVNRAQDRYSQVCGGYAPSLRELARTGEPSLPPDSTSVTRVTQHGYLIEVEPAGDAFRVANPPPGCEGSISNYFAHADPVTVGGTGTRYFATDARVTIFQSAAEAIANPIPVTAVPVQ